jgi:caffeic acid 3-O-methyltransferase
MTFLAMISAVLVLPVLSFAPISLKVKSRLLHDTDLLMSTRKTLSPSEANEAITPLLELSSMHFTSQALHTFVKLGIPDIIGCKKVSLDEIGFKISPNVNRDALLRTLKLLVSAEILHYASDELESEHYFQLTNTGALLQSKESDQPSMASGIKHWMEEPLWNAWLSLPEYIQGTLKDEKNLDPFERANGISSDYYYNAEDHPESLKFANDFVRFVSDSEIHNIATCIDWSQYEGKTILDIGGHNGKVLEAVAASLHHSNNIDFKCLDLPSIIDGIEQTSDFVDLIGGNILDESTVPPADVIVMKHFLDRCMWDEEQTLNILKTCHDKIPDDGRVILGEAVIPDCSQAKPSSRLEISLDALYMLVGRERQRTESEWRALADASGFTIDEIMKTSSPTCSLIVMKKQ